MNELPIARRPGLRRSVARGVYRLSAGSSFKLTQIAHPSPELYPPLCRLIVPDYLYRNFHDLYGDFVNTTTGRVIDSTGQKYDLDVLKNNPDAKRTYKGVIASVSYRWPSVQVGGNYIHPVVVAG